jgi:hypothetical protein
MIGRIIIQSPAEQAAQSARMLKGHFSRNVSINKLQLKKLSRNYDPSKDLNAAAARPGADDALSIPSRIGNRLHYRDGRVTSIATLQESQP